MILIWIIFQAGMATSGSATFDTQVDCEFNRALIVSTAIDKGVKAKSIYANCTPKNSSGQ